MREIDPQRGAGCIVRFGRKIPAKNVVIRKAPERIIRETKIENQGGEN